MGASSVGQEAAQNSPLGADVQPPKLPDAGPVYHVGGGFTPPKVVKRVDPEYSDEARKHKLQGKVVLSIVIGKDGIPHDIHLVTPALGRGLDENAILAVSQWRFEPGQRDGQSVETEVKVEVSFRLYKKSRGSD